MKNNSDKIMTERVCIFRVLIDDEENDIYRDIEIRSDQTFEDFHNIIQDSFGFDKSQMASFYLCNDKWRKKTEITLLNMNELDYNEEDENILVMNNTLLKDHITSEEQKLIYVFDFLNVWSFYVELQSFNMPVKGKKYPVCTKSAGQAPEQYSKNISGDIDVDAIKAGISDPDTLFEDNDFFSDSYEEYGKFSRY